MGISLIILFIFFALYKISYFEIKDDEIGVIESFEIRSSYYDSTSEYLKKIFFYNEWGQVASNLSLSTQNDLGRYYDLPKVVIGSIPLIKNFSDISEEDVRFSRLIKKYANPGFTYGLGSNIWGEAYAALNIFGVILFSIIISLLIAILNKKFYTSNPLYLFSILFLSFLSFYVHRNDLTLVFAHVKNIVFLIILTGFLFIIYKTFKFLLFNSKKPILN